MLLERNQGRSAATSNDSLNPDCGFAPGKDHEIPLEEAYAKLKNLAAAARLLRQQRAVI
jgi:methionine synthase II (cobalamin-independent)